MVHGEANVPAQLSGYRWALRAVGVLGGRVGHKTLVVLSPCEEEYGRDVLARGIRLNSRLRSIPHFAFEGRVRIQLPRGRAPL